MECAEARRLLSRRLDATLSSAELASYESHALTCSTCAGMARMWELENAGLKDLWPAVRAPDGFTAAVLERLPARTAPAPGPRLRRIAVAAGVVLALSGVSV